MKKYNWLSQKSNRSIIQTDKQFWTTLSEEAYPITKGDLRIPVSLEPFVISKDEYNYLLKHLTLFVSAARKMAEKYFEDEEIRKVIVVNEKEKELIDKSRDENFVGIIRIDLFLDKKFQIVEINSDFPDGFFMHDITSKTINDLSGRNFHIPNHARLFDELLVSEGINRNSHIFIGYDKKRTFVDEFFLSKLQLEKLGWKNVSVGAFEDLNYKNRDFYFKNKKVEVIRRGAELFKLRKIPKLIDRLIEVETKSNLKIINNFKMRLLGHKSLLVALHDLRFRKYLTPDEVKAIDILLPRTIRFDGCDVKKIIKEKDSWVLKPSDLAEGENVSVGKSLNKKEWKRALESASVNPLYWVLQECVSIPEETFKLIEQNTGKIITRRRKYDFNPHVVLFKKQNKLGNIISRFSESEILNIMKGGGLTYVFVNE